MDKWIDDEPGHCSACGHWESQHGEGGGRCFALPYLFDDGECWCPKFVTDFAEAVSLIIKHGDIPALQRNVHRAMDRGDRANANGLLHRYLVKYPHEKLPDDWIRGVRRHIETLPEAPPAIQKEAKPLEECEFVYSDDYRAITFKGNKYALTTNQAIVVQALHEAHQHDLAGLSSATLLEKIGSPNSRLQDSFKSGDGPTIWKILITRRAKGLYSLNLE